jgi:ankyrin repeat protein
MAIPFNISGFRITILLVSILLSANSKGQQVSFYDQNTDPEYKLLIASTVGDTASIRTLTELGTSVDIQSSTGDTPLMLSVIYNQPEAVILFLELGADTELSNYLGERPLHAAIKNQNLPLAELLIRYGADINCTDVNGASPLHYAALYGYWYEADMLIYYDAYIDRKSLDGTTPLMAAVMSGSFDIADVLIREGADVNNRDNGGYTPLLLAAQNGDTLMSELLLRNGASLYATADDGYTAASISVRDNHPGYFKYILGKGNLWNETGQVNLWLVADRYRRKEFVELFRILSIPKPEHGGVRNISAGISYLASWHQYFTGLHLSTRNDLAGTGIITGVDLKPFKSRILIEEDDLNYSQYIDKRAIAYAGLFKDFIISNNTSNTRWLLTLTGKAAWKFGNSYPGTSLKPEHGLALIPAASVSLEIPGAAFFISAEYMRSEVYKSGPLWLRAGITVNYYFDNVQSKGKTIRWY